MILKNQLSEIIKQRCHIRIFLSMHEIKMSAVGGLLLLVISVLLLVQCGGQLQWYPSGKAEIVSHYEHADEFGALCVVTYRVENTGEIEINESTIVLKLVTDTARYYDTIIDQTPVPPGKAILGNKEISYYSAEESIALKGITIEDYFFK
jgi:hypothetical protein